MSDSSWLDKSKAEVERSAAMIQAQKQRQQEERAAENEQQQKDKEVLDRIRSKYLEPLMCAAVESTNLAYGPDMTESQFGRPWSHAIIQLSREDLPKNGQLTIKTNVHAGSVSLSCHLNISDRQAPLLPMTGGHYEAKEEDKIEDWIKKAIATGIEQFSKAQL